MTPRAALGAVQHCTFRAALDCHYLLSVPERVEATAVLAVALHGYGQKPEIMLPLVRNLLGPQPAIAAVQAPHCFYLSAEPEAEVGYCWVTREYASESVRLHHDMLLHVLNEAGQRCGIPAQRRMLVGFSQPVGLNYRFAATHPEAVKGVIGICGGLPGNWEEGPYQPMTASVLHIARREDPFYKPEVTQRYRERLLLRAADVEFHLLEGGHRFPSKGGPLVEAWMRRVF